MTKAKTFDCLEMKRAVQAGHAQEYAALTDEEIGRRIQQKLATSDHPVSVWYRKVRAQKAESAKS